jgi:predicted ester cyclase
VAGQRVRTRGEPQGVAATGRAIQLSATTVHHLVDGKIVETWVTFDNLELLQQRAAVPQPAQS